MVDKKRVAKSVYFDPKIYDKIEKFRLNYNLSFSAVVNDGMEKVLGRAEGESKDVEGRLQALSASLKEHRDKTGQDMLMLTELVLNFIQFYIFHTPSIPDNERDAAKAEAGARFEKFLEEFQENIRAQKE